MQTIFQLHPRTASECNTHTQNNVYRAYSSFHTRNRGIAEGRFAEEVVQTDTSSHNTNIPRATFPITREPFPKGDAFAQVKQPPQKKKNAELCDEWFTEK